MVMQQLPLGIRLRDHATFDNFFPGGNRQLFELMRQAAVRDDPPGDGGDATSLYLWGAAGSGKSHLLQAACRAVSERGRVALFIPLSERRLFTPAVLDELETTALVCLDDIDAIAALPEWEEAIFHLYNRIQQSSAQLMISANCAPQQLTLSLPDLATRLGWGLVFQLGELDDEQKLQAMQQRAAAIGMEMGDDVARYLYSRTRRDTHSLFTLLEQLDRATLTAQRRLTVPFLKAFLEIAG